MINNKESNFVSAVIYVHNCENEIQNFLKRVHTALASNFAKYEIICVDDKCTDASVEQIKAFAENVSDVSITILHMSYFQGVELAMNAGVDLAIGDFVYEFDKVAADFPQELIMEIYHVSLSGYDIVSAAPQKMENWTSRMFYGIYNRVSNHTYQLRTERFRILSRRAINRIHSMCESVPYRKAVYANCGLKMTTITYVPQATGVRESREEKGIRQDMAFNSLILFTNIAYRFSILLATLMMLLAVFIGIYTVIIFISAKPVAGWTTTMMFLSLAFFGVFAIFAIIIKYLTVLMDLIFTKQRYMIEGIEKIK